MNVEQSKYERLWREHAEYRAFAPGENLAEHFLALARPRPHQTVIDFGCGTGRGALRIAQRTGATVRAFDFVDGCMDAEVRQSGLVQFEQRDLTVPLLLERPADFGYCTDVLEHIPPEDVDAVLANIVSSARRVYLCISTVDDAMGALIGEPLHLTVQPAVWWREKLETLLQCRIYVEQVLDGAVIFYLSAWATFDDIEHRVELNVEEQLIRANIRANLDAKLQELRPYPANETEIILLAGGPSLADHEDEIRAMHRRENGTPVVTVNGAYNWAIERGFVPGMQVVLDAREFNRRFVEPVLPLCRYALGSQCDPRLVAAVPRDQVLLWHGAGERVHEWIREFDEERGQAREYWPVSGGGTVTTRALSLLAMLGFRRIHVYGFDSCVRGRAHHAYAQPENDGAAVVRIEVAGREFYCEGWMLKQAQEFQAVMQHVLIPAGVELAVHGDGLIAAIIEAAAAAKE